MSERPYIRSRSVVILGTDAIVAARPATPAQLARACLRAGYDAVVPATIGEELIAAEAIGRAGQRPDSPAVLCVCPRVGERLLARSHDLAAFLLPLVPPPVATARYVRAGGLGVVGGEGAGPLRIVYVGDCPGAVDPAIDQWIGPRELLALLRARDATPANEPDEPDERFAELRRRHYSLPGGVPAPERLGDRRLVEVEEEDYILALAQRLIERDPSLVDLGIRLGCACAGAHSAFAPTNARREVAAGEPQRAAEPIVAPATQLSLERPLPPPTTEEPRVRAGEPPAPLGEQTPPHGGRPYSPRGVPKRRTAGERQISEADPAKRRGPGTGIFRPYTASIRTNSGEGKPLPRAYAAHRRTSSSADSRSSATAPEPRPPAPAAAAAPAPPVTPAPPTAPAVPTASDAQPSWASRVLARVVETVAAVWKRKAEKPGDA